MTVLLVHTCKEGGQGCRSGRGWGGGGGGRGGRVCVEGNSAEKGESKRMEKEIKIKN